MQGAVFVHRDTGLDYPVAAPFDPSVAYPEWAGEPVGKEENRVYDAVSYTHLTLPTIYSV